MASHRSEVFFAKVGEYGLEDVVGAFKAKGITSFATFAFASNFNPQMANADVLTDELLVPLSSGDGTLVPKLRMLWWESWGVTTADMRKASEAKEDDKPRKLTPAEVNARKKAVLDKVPGLTITRELEVSPKLLETCVDMYDGDCLKYLPWELCTMAEMEMAGAKKDENLARDTVGVFMAGACGSLDINVDLALRRRGLALAMADVLAYEVHEKLREELVSTLLEKPPPGYCRVSVEQVRKADEIVFYLLGRECPDGIKRAGGARPLDSAMTAAMSNRRFQLALQPLQAGTKRHDGEPPATATGDAGPTRSAQKRERKKRKVEESIAAASGRAQSSGGQSQPAGPFGGGNGKGKGRSAALPLALRVPGADAADEDGHPICFQFNLGGCPAAVHGGRCPKGRHVCILRSCKGAGHAWQATHAR